MLRIPSMVGIDEDNENACFACAAQRAHEKTGWTTDLFAFAWPFAFLMGCSEGIRVATTPGAEVRIILCVRHANDFMIIRSGTDIDQQVEVDMVVVGEGPEPAS
jgi:hypothetical protein